MAKVNQDERKRTVNDMRKDATYAIDRARSRLRSAEIMARDEYYNGQLEFIDKQIAELQRKRDRLVSDHKDAPAIVAQCKEEIAACFAAFEEEAGYGYYERQSKPKSSGGGGTKRVKRTDEEKKAAKAAKEDADLEELLASMDPETRKKVQAALAKN